MNGEYDLDEDGYPTWVELGLPLVRCTPTTGSLKPAGGAAVEIRRYVSASRHDALLADRDRLAAELAEVKSVVYEMNLELAKYRECVKNPGSAMEWIAVMQAELSAARAEREEVMEFLCKFINGGVNQEYRTWGRELYLRMYGAASSAGIAHEGCGYLAEAGSVCNKCGRVVPTVGGRND